MHSPKFLLGENHCTTGITISLSPLLKDTTGKYTTGCSYHYYIVWLLKLKALTTWWSWRVSVMLCLHTMHTGGYISYVSLRGAFSGAFFFVVLRSGTLSLLILIGSDFLHDSKTKWLLLSSYPDVAGRNNTHAYMWLWMLPRGLTGPKSDRQV